MAVLRLERPQPKQMLFLTANTDFVGYGGARGGGKSWAVQTKAILSCLTYPGIKCLIVRRSFPELQENHILPMQAKLKGVARYNESKKRFTFTNGSSIKFAYCRNESDVGQFQGVEYDFIFIDEATQLSETQFEWIKSANRGNRPYPKRVYCTMNPGGIGHNWVKRLFVDRRYKEGENPEDYTFIRASLYDNPALMKSSPKYVKLLEGLSADLRKAWLEGDWNIFVGQYFPEFSLDTHVIDPIPIPDNWKWYFTMDYGLDMAALYWIAVDESGNAYVVREYCQGQDVGPNKEEMAVGMLISDLVEKVNSITEELGIKSRITYLAPPDMWGKSQESGKSVADMFYERGMSLNKVSNDRVAGWMSMKEWIKPVKGSPKLRIFRNCAKLIDYIPMLQFDIKKPSDVAKEPHYITHSPDAIRNFCVYWITNALSKDALKRSEWTEDQYDDYMAASESEKRKLIKRWGNPF